VENVTLCVEIVPVGMLQTNCYILSREGSNACVVVDPGGEAKRILAAAGDRKIAAVLLTHGHFDHISAADGIMQPDTALYIHQADAAMLRDPGLNVSWMIGRNVTVEAEVQTVREGSVIDAAGICFTVLHTPGHTPGSCCYLAENVLLTGDTLFADGGFGRFDFKYGDKSVLGQSLHRLFAMDGDIAIYPGHGRASTLRDEHHTLGYFERY
jgi:glyoxylase-like metal-dependent hydrolase (beta-lactamase superfamily II)